MACYRPLKGFRTPGGVVFSELRRDDILGDIELPCGQCIGCRIRRSQEWTLRVTHEAQLWPENSFLTLTYAPENLPPLGSLNHRDVQLFLKRARKELNKPLRYFMCGEYGDQTARPHYHMCLFNESFRPGRKPAGKSKGGYLFHYQEQLTNLWGLGIATVQDLNPQTAGYCSQYITKKLYGQQAEAKYRVIDPETGEIHHKKPEYAAMSLKPGIGAKWYEKYGRDVYPHDFAILDGTKLRPPKYYDKLMRRSDQVDSDLIEYNRQRKALNAKEDNTEERRKVREQVTNARMVNKLKRELE